MARNPLFLHRSHAPRINRFLQELNPDTKLRVVELDPEDLSGVLSLREFVEKGEYVGILADRHPPGSKKRSIKMPFLGKEADLPQSPWLLASLLECPVTFVNAVRTAPRTYRIAAEAFSERVPSVSRTNQGSIDNLVAKYARRLEQICCESPMQWFNFYDFWKSE